MKCISIRQPWAWLIIHGGKDIENRTWRTDLRGPVLIHAAKGMTRIEYDDAKEFVYCVNEGISIPPFPMLERGGFIGKVTMTGCVSESDSPWFVGPWGHVYKDPVSLPFKPYTGSLGYFEV